MGQDKITIGDKFLHEFQYTQDEVQLFAKATGDFNPIHLDDEYAKETIFKKPIIHGFLGGSIFSKIFGTLWPGEGTIYLKQSMTFVKPMHVETKYCAHLEVKETIEEERKALIQTEIRHSNKLVIKGEALIIHPHKI